MLIILAQKKDITPIVQLLKRCAMDLQKKGVFQWNKAYPSQEIIEKDIQLKQLHLLKSATKIIGTIVLTNIKDKEYMPIQWGNNKHKAMYIHRLAVDPVEQQKGYAQQLMDFAENVAIAQHYESIRLDTFSQNNKNQQFYTKRGYSQKGNIYLPAQSDAPFYCFEKLMIPTS